VENTFLKWAGGKNWFVRYYNNMLPQKYKRYIDPFLGGGSVYFYLEPENAIISDINQELITTFIAIRDNWQKVYEILKLHSRKHSYEYYYRVRNMKPRTPATIAARMIYLNRTCFNGIYRVNRNGEFNVPIGDNTNILLETDKFKERSKILQGTQILCQDFEKTIELSQEDDFLFCDPPYAVLEEDNRFVNYTGQLFNWNDQIRLANCLHKAKERGVKIIMTNVNHAAVRSLYESIDGYKFNEVARFSSISGKSVGRKRYKELIISANID
jgi:DNA adenine methylase